jgi:hypothetical protein
MYISSPFIKRNTESLTQVCRARVREKDQEYVSVARDSTQPPVQARTLKVCNDPSLLYIYSQPLIIHFHPFPISIHIISLSINTYFHSSSIPFPLGNPQRRLIRKMRKRDRERSRVSQQGLHYPDCITYDFRKSYREQHPDEGGLSRSNINFGELSFCCTGACKTSSWGVMMGPQYVTFMTHLVYNFDIFCDSWTQNLP